MIGSFISSISVGLFVSLNHLLIFLGTFKFVCQQPSITLVPFVLGSELVSHYCPLLSLHEGSDPFKKQNSAFVQRFIVSSVLVAGSEKLQAWAGILVAVV